MGSRQGDCVQPAELRCPRPRRIGGACALQQVFSARTVRGFEKGRGVAKNRSADIWSLRERQPQRPGLLIADRVARERWLEIVRKQPCLDRAGQWNIGMVLDQPQDASPPFGEIGGRLDPVGDEQRLQDRQVVRVSRRRRFERHDLRRIGRTVDVADGHLRSGDTLEIRAKLPFALLQCVGRCGLDVRRSRPAGNDEERRGQTTNGRRGLAA